MNRRGPLRLTNRGSSIRKVHPFEPQDARGVQAAFLAVLHHRDVGVGHAQRRIDPIGHCHEGRAVRRIGVEEIAVVEIPVGAGVGDRLRRLVDREIVTLGQHSGLLEFP
jgi:hypothetical protein